MLAQLESLLLAKSNWVRIAGKIVSNFVNLDYVVGYSSGPDGGYILVLTTGENVVVTAKDMPQCKDQGIWIFLTGP